MLFAQVVPLGAELKIGPPGIGEAPFGVAALSFVEIEFLKLNIDTCR
jgi:hypothetical protein